MTMMTISFILFALQFTLVSSRCSLKTQSQEVFIVNHPIDAWSSSEIHQRTIIVTYYTNTYSKGLRDIRDLPLELSKTGDRIRIPRSLVTEFVSLEAWWQNSYPSKCWEGYEFWLQAERCKSRIPRQTFGTKILSINSQWWTDLI